MAVSNSLTNKPQQKKTGLVAYLNQDAVKNQINSIVGSKRGTAFITSIVSAVQATPALQECTNQSILSATLLGESLNLSPSVSLGQYWLIPYNNKKKGVKECQFQLGSAGFKQLAMRTGQYRDIDFIEIKEGEYIGRDKYTGKQKFEFIEDDDIRESLPTIGYMAYFELLNGFRKSVYWSKAKMEAHADKYSQSFNLDTYRKIQEGKIPQSEMWKYSSPWLTDFPSMAEKTLIKHILSKWGILSTELITAIDSDQAVINSDGTKNYVDNEEPEEVKVKAEVVEPETKQADVSSALFG